MSKSDLKVARKYARALFDACQPSNYESVQAIISNIADAFLVQQVREAFQNPSVRQEQRLDWLKGIISESCPQEEKNVTNLFSILIENKRIGVLSDLAASFAELVSAYKKILCLEVTTSKQLSTSEHQVFGDKLKSNLPADLASQINFEWHINPDLIAGAQVKIGDKIIDGSVQASIGRIAQELKG
jgi:F-type H+-transporting ATPase subunit delta